MSGIQQMLLGGAPAVAANYIEDVFSTYLYTGNGSSQTITNGIDLAGKGGMVWLKNRNDGNQHFLFDTARGRAGSFNRYCQLNTDSTDSQLTGTNQADRLTSFNSNGFTLSDLFATNGSGNIYSSWTFRKQAKFFDVVTYTGNGSNRTIAHSLGSVPGCIIVKRTDTTGAWAVYHRSLANTEYLVLNTTAAKATGATYWNSTTPTSTEFSLGTATDVNANGGTYVAYLFAHDAGGFGLTGTDNVISCGSATVPGGSGIVSVNLGWEPQFVLYKEASTSNWTILDTMRGWFGGEPSVPASRTLAPNTSAIESSGNVGSLNATGFSTYALNVGDMVYLAIRRGPMKTPTSGTSVFGLNARSGTGANATVTGGQTDDAVLIKNRGSAVGDLFASRLTGTGYLETSSTAAEVAAGTTILQANPWDVMDGVKVGTTSTITNASSNTYINYLFRRAPGFFDVVCYTGTGANRTVSHNLGVAPELMIVKSRSAEKNWGVYAASLGNGSYLNLNTTSASGSTTTLWNSTSPTSSVFTVGTALTTNENTTTYVAYLFASVSGVSKVGSYTGNGSSQTINCGFTAGSRFVLIKRTDAAGNWYVFDSARGIVAGNDPYLLLNSTAAEVTTYDAVDTDNSGFVVNNDATNYPINVNGATYIFLSIA